MMKNKMFDFQDIYGMLRKYYLSNFPHAIKLDVKKILEHYFEYYKIDGEFTLQFGKENILTFNLKSKSSEPDPMYSDQFDQIKYRVEVFLSQDQNVTNLCEDIRAMNSWLLIENYIRTSYAPDVYIASSALISNTILGKK